MVQRSLPAALMKRLLPTRKLPACISPGVLPFRRRRNSRLNSPRLFQIAADDMKYPGAAQNHEDVPIARSAGKLERAVVRLAHLGGRIAFGGHQRRTQRNQQIQLLLQSPVRSGKPRQSASARRNKVRRLRHPRSAGAHSQRRRR